MAQKMETIVGELRSLAAKKLAEVDAEGARHREWLQDTAEKTKAALAKLREEGAAAAPAGAPPRRALKDAAAADKENASAAPAKRSGRSTRAARRNAASSDDWQTLAAMGHSEADARRALAACNGDLQGATKMLMKEKKAAKAGDDSHPAPAAPQNDVVVIPDSPVPASDAGDDVAADSDVEEAATPVQLHDDGLRDMKLYEVKALRVVVLREACKVRGLDSTGTKATMMERLGPALEAERALAEEVVPPSPEAEVPAQEDADAEVVDANPDEVLGPEESPELEQPLKGRASRRASRLSCAHELRPMDKREARRVSRAHAIASHGVPPLVPKPADAPAPAAAATERQQGGQPSPEEEADSAGKPRQSLFAGKTPAANRARGKSACPTTGKRRLRGPAALPDSPTEGVTPSKPTRRIPAAPAMPSTTAAIAPSGLPPSSPMQLCSPRHSGGAIKRAQDASPGAKAVGSSPAMRRTSKLRRSHENTMKLGVRAAAVPVAATAADPTAASQASPKAHEEVEPVVSEHQLQTGSQQDAEKREQPGPDFEPKTQQQQQQQQPDQREQPVGMDVCEASHAAGAPVSGGGLADSAVGTVAPMSAMNAKTPAAHALPVSQHGSSGPSSRSGGNSSADPQKSAAANAAWERLQKRRVHGAGGPSPPSAGADAAVAAAEHQPAAAANTEAKKPTAAVSRAAARPGAQAQSGTAAPTPANRLAAAARPVSAAPATKSHSQTVAEHRKRLEEEQRKKQAEWERKERELEVRRKAAETAEREERRRKAEEATARRKEAEARSKAATEERERLRAEAAKAEEARRKAEEAERRRRMVERAQEAQRKAAGAERRRKEEEARKAERAEAERKAKAAREAAATAAANVKRSAEEQRRVAEKAAAAIRAKNAATAAAGRPAPATSTTSLTSLGGAHSVGSGALQGLLAKKQATAVHKPSLATPSAPAQRLGGAVRVTQEEAYQSYEISPYRENSDSEDDAPRKAIPRWAHRELLAHRLRAQQYVDPDKVFGKMGGTTTDLSAVFDGAVGNKRKPNFKRRSSTGNWAADLLTFQEELHYRQAMGFH